MVEARDQEDAFRLVESNMDVKRKVAQAVDNAPDKSQAKQAAKQKCKARVRQILEGTDPELIETVEEDMVTTAERTAGRWADQKIPGDYQP